MKTVDEDTEQRLETAYCEFFDVFDRNKLAPEDAFSLLVNLTVQIAGDMPKGEMLQIIDQVYDHDRAMRLSSKEVH